MQSIETLIDQGQFPLANQALQDHYAQACATNTTAMVLAEMIPLGLRILEDGEFEDRWAVSKLLSQWGNGVIGPLLKVWRNEGLETEHRWFAGRLLAHFPQADTIAALVQVLTTSDSEELTAIAAQSLAQIGQPALEALIPLLAEPETRRLATKALAQIPSRAVIEPLLAVMQDADETIRTWAISALANFADASILPALQAACTDLSPRVRQEAVTALGNASHFIEANEVIAQLQPRLFDLNLEVCQRAAIALSRVKTDQCATVLWSVWRSPTTPSALGLTILQSLAWLESPLALHYLHQAFAQAPDPEKLEIIQLLGRIQSPELAPEIEKILEQWIPAKTQRDSDIALATKLAYSWGKLQQVSAIPQLRLWATHSQPGLRLQAIAALKQCMALQKV